MLDMEDLLNEKVVDPNDLTYYANYLARTIVALNVMGGGHKIQLLKRLAYLYDPKLSPTVADLYSSPEPSVEQRRDITVQPEEFIILAYQTWLSIPDETVKSEAVQLESSPNTPEAISTSLPMNQPEKPTAVIVHPAPSVMVDTKNSNNTNSFSGLWQSFKNAMDYVDSKTTPPQAPVISSETLAPPLSTKQKLLNEFNKAGTLPYQKESEISKRFEQMYHNAFVKYDNKNPLPNIENREVLICPLIKMRFYSKVIEGFKNVYLNILSAETFETGRDDEPTGTNRALSDNKKVALMRILQRAINKLKFGESHQQGRKDLIEKMNEFIGRINEEFRKEDKIRTQQKFAELIQVINGYHVTHGIPIQVIVAAINEMQQIAADLLNDQVSSFNVQAVQTFYNDKNNIEIKKDLEYEILNQTLDIRKLHSEYDFAGPKRFNLMDAVDSSNEKFLKVQNEVLSRITSRIEILKQTICTDLAEIEKLRPQLSEQDNQLQKNHEEIQKLNNEKDSLNTQIKAANDLVDNKNSIINMRNITLQKNVMHNYNKKYRYTSFTLDILNSDNKDKRAPEDKLADRWWDNVWFLGIERFLNWCAGTTKQERKEDAVAAVKLYNATERKVKADEQTLQIKQEKIEWLFEDISKAELDYKNGMTHQTEYNLMISEWEDAKRNTESDEAKKRITRLPEIQQSVEQIEKSNRELEPNKSQTAKRLDECKQHVYKNNLELTSIKTRLQSGVNNIVQKILSLSDDSYRATFEMLSSLKSKMENIVTDIEQPFSIENKTALPITTSSSTTDNVHLSFFKPS